MSSCDPETTLWLLRHSLDRPHEDVDLDLVIDLLIVRTAIVEVEERMVWLIDALGYLQLATSIDGLSPVGAAAILAETGDPHVYDTGRAWAKHAGICPRDNRSGTFRGQSTTSGRGRPVLRTATWQAIWGLLPHNAVFAAYHHRLTHREVNRLGTHRPLTHVAATCLLQNPLRTHETAHPHGSRTTPSWACTDPVGVARAWVCSGFG